ncbi:MAG: hypothetical protein JW715_12205 [Sedimentisphaerales bacterium]|nr:hypothetical protein [Sedimentisphaerales bacterium]
MESKENNDIFNLAADNIIKWYEQTRTTMVTIKLSSQHDVELMGILLAARKHTLGVLTTLANKNILSTHALLRVLVEIFIVLKWILNVSTNDTKTKSDEVYKRLRRWDITRLNKDKIMLENLPRTSEVESAIKQIEDDIDNLKNAGIKVLPNVKQLHDDLLQNESGEIYAKSYMTYSRAIHLNRNITEKLAWTRRENEEPKEVLYKDDIEPDGYELLIIASISCDINKAIRDFYNWNSDVIQHEYEQLKSRLNKN